MVSWLGTWLFHALPSEGVFSTRMEVKICSFVFGYWWWQRPEYSGESAKSPPVQFLAFSFPGVTEEVGLGVCKVERAY